MATKKEKKSAYFLKVEKLFKEYKNIMVVNVDNVSSSLMQRCRMALRGKAVILMGKNTLLRRAAKQIKNIHGLDSLMEKMKGNVGLVFSNEDLAVVRDTITKNKISGPAKPGQVAPCDVIVPKGNTGLEPGQTTFLQALNIATKIAKGTIEILNDVQVIKKGERVGNSEATLLQKLKITPFFFEVTPLLIFEDGSVFPVDVLDIGEEVLLEQFAEGNQNLTIACLGLGVPAASAVPYYLKDGFKNIIAISEATNYSFPLAEKFANASKNATVVAAAAPPPAAAAAATKKDDKKEPPKKEEPKKEEPKKEEEEEENFDMGGLFDD